MPRTQDSPIAWGAAKESKLIIIEAAAKCFEQYGAQRTSMDDIAEAAGISRKTLYRVFNDRPKLIQAVLQHRWAKVFKKIQNRIAKSNTIEEALLESVVTAVSGARSDKLVNDIIHNATDHTLEQFLIRGNERIYQANLEIWKPMIEKGREEGVIKAHLTDDRIIEIITSINALLVMRDEGPAKQRAFLKDVLLPAILIAPGS